MGIYIYIRMTYINNIEETKKATGEGDFLRVGNQIRYNTNLGNEIVRHVVKRDIIIFIATVMSPKQLI